MPHIYISFDGDGIGQLIGRAKLADDDAAITDINNAINAGNQLFKDFALKYLGSVVEIGGDEGTIKVPAEALETLQDLKDAYYNATKATVSIGVGTKVSTASKALLAAKIQGKDRIVLYTPDLDELLENVQEKEESAKIADEYLNKNDDLEGLIQDLDYRQEEPTPPETQSMDALEQQFRELAGHKGLPQQPVSDEVKARVVKVIEFIQQNPEQLQLLKIKNPELYTSMNELVSALIEVVKNGSLHETEQNLEEAPSDDDLLDKAEEDPEHVQRQNKIAELTRNTRGSAWNTNTGEFVVVGLDPHDRRQWRATSLDSNGEHKFHRVAPTHEGALMLAHELGADLLRPPKQIMRKSEEGCAFDALRKDLMPGGKGDDKPDDNFDPEQLALGIKTEMEEHGLDEARAKEVAKDHLVEDPSYYSKSLDKAGALEAGKTGRHNVILPIGSVHDGKILVVGPDGTGRWISAKAGLIMSPTGQPTSSRNPSGLKPKDEEQES